MAELKHIIEPERMGLWVAVTFILTLLSLVIGLVSIQRITITTAATQVEVALLNKQIADLRKAAAAPVSTANNAAPVPQPAGEEQKAAP